MDRELRDRMERECRELEVNDKFDYKIDPRQLTTTLDRLSTEQADTIVISNPSQWEAVPFPKVGFGWPAPNQHTAWKSDDHYKRTTTKGPTQLVMRSDHRAIYMVSDLPTLNRIKMKSDVLRLNIVVAKPLRTRKQFNDLFNGPKWAENRDVNYYGVWGVPEVLSDHHLFNPRAARAYLQNKVGEKAASIRARDLKAREKVHNFRYGKGALQKTRSVVKLMF